MNKFLLLISSFLCVVPLLAQPPLLPQENVIYQAQAVEINTAGKVFKIVHIGDSHIQADWFSGKTRQLLQESYGNAGMGLIFPYKPIKTNGPKSFTCNATHPLNAGKIVKCKSSCEIGLAAYNAYIPAGCELNFVLKNDSLPQYVEVLTNPVSQGSYFLNKDDNPKHYQEILGGSFLVNRYQVPLQAPVQLNAIQDFTLYGLLTHNNQYGVRYYTIGANGATFQQYANSALFFEQLKYLEADMVIVSLGTNESVSDITQDSFSMALNSFHQLLSQTVGKAPIIYTTPSDNYTKQIITTRKKVKGKYKKVKKVVYVNNSKVEMIREAMLNYCAQNKIMCWDMYKAIGGDTSMKDWVRSGYAAKDHIHFSKGGYEIQGNLLFDALINYVFLE